MLVVRFFSQILFSSGIAFNMVKQENNLITAGHVNACHLDLTFKPWCSIWGGGAGGSSPAGCHILKPP